MNRKLSSASSLDVLRLEAKRWLKALRANDPAARARLEKIFRTVPTDLGLREIQHALALEYGCESWSALKLALAKANPKGARATATPLRSAGEYNQVAHDFVTAFDTRDEAALQRLNAAYRRSFTFDDLFAEIWRRVYALRQRAFREEKKYLLPAEAQTVVAQDAGFGSWDALMRAIATGASPLPSHRVDTQEDSIAPRRRLSDADWDSLLAEARARRVTRLDADGQMTDAVMARLAELDHLTALSLGGSRELSDDGLRHLARMPQLQHLDLNEYPGGKLTDRGLEVLRHLPNLRSFEMTWQSGITDAGVANLRFCEQLERVNLLGSPTGNGAIAALQGKPHLRAFSSGRFVTDDGLALLKQFPRFKTRFESPSGDGENDGAKLVIDGPFSNAGLASLADLEGVTDLDLFWHVNNITSEGFAHLVHMPNLSGLAADGRLSDDVALRHFAEIPRLRRLRIQETVATDDGFEALSRSPTLEGIWGRNCERLGSRGFIALSRLPALRSLGVSCKNVEDHALATLPSFPSLRELTPIGMQDAGFAHVGRCERLERLTCMYCRDTTDIATAHIRSLRLKYYYAGLTRITDQTLEMLGEMPTLEKVEFYECHGVTDAGLVFLAKLPHLREVEFGSLPGVTLEGTRIFPQHVHVRYST